MLDPEFVGKLKPNVATSTPAAYSKPTKPRQQNGQEKIDMPQKQKKVKGTVDGVALMKPSISHVCDSECRTKTGSKF